VRPTEFDGIQGHSTGHGGIRVSVLRVSRDELLALYSMTQELAPLGVDCLPTWELHRRLWAAYRQERNTPSTGMFSLVNADWESIGDSPVIAVTLHYDPLFFDGVVRLAERVGQDLGKPVRVVAREGLESSPTDEHKSMRLLSVESPDFPAEVMSALQERGMLIATVDANQGSSPFHGSPFLQHELEVRTALFRLARAAGARILPFVVNSQADRIYLGPVIDVREQGITKSIDQAVRFLEHHVIRAPERWMHWRYAMKLMSIVNTNSRLAGVIEGPQQWVLSADKGFMAFDLGSVKLFSIDKETYGTLLDGGAAGHDSE
jgi:hypothetical protein